MRPFDVTAGLVNHIIFEAQSMSTAENLKQSFAGESQANQKYRAFAKKAEQEGLPGIAKLFLTAAEAERIHAEGHLAAMEGIGTTAANLQAAIDGETYEYETMYPPMLEQAQSENHRAKRMFTYALEAERVHAALYKQALEALNQGQDLDVTGIYFCPVCGHIEFDKAPSACPICGAKGQKYVQV